jgi:hypothetical protein
VKTNAAGAVLTDRAAMKKSDDFSPLEVFFGVVSAS